MPFTLRSGKALGKLRREVVITFKRVDRLPAGFTGVPEPSVLRILLGPDRIELGININASSDPFALNHTVLSTNFAESSLSPYAEVLSGTLDGDPTLSVRGDTAEQCWHIVQPVLDAWRAGTVPLDEYAAGTGGPSSWAVL